MIDHLVENGFVPARSAHLLMRDHDVASLLDRLAQHTGESGALKWSGPPLER